MKVFISWSGEVSGEVARIFCDWLPNVIQGLEIFISKDIPKGENWDNEIEEALNSSTFSIVCLTRDNLNSPWLNFEAGALSKAIVTNSKNKVCTFLLGLAPDEVSGPLKRFQHTIYTQKDIKKLISTLNESADHIMKKENFPKIFDKWWPELDEQLTEVYQKVKKKIIWAFETKELKADAEIQHIKNQYLANIQAWYVGEEPPPEKDQCDILIYTYGNSDHSKERLKELIKFAKALEDKRLIVYARDEHLPKEEKGIADEYERTTMANMPERLYARVKDAM